MHNIITIATTLLLAGSLAAAPSNHVQSRDSRQGPVSSADHEHRGAIDQAVEESQNTHLTGCLQSAQGTYWLSDHVATYRLTGDTQMLRRYVGHEVSVSGTEAAGSYSSASQGRTFRVDDANETAGTCSSRSPVGRTRAHGGAVGNPQDRPVEKQNGSSRSAARESNSNRSGVAERANEKSDPYEPHPKNEPAATTMPNPPLDHPRPQDQTPSAGTAAGTKSGARARTPSTTRRKSNRKHQGADSKRTNSPTPPPQL